MAHGIYASDRLTSKHLWRTVILVFGIIALIQLVTTGNAQSDANETPVAPAVTAAPVTAPPIQTALQNFVVFGANGVMLQKSDVVDSGYIGTYNHAILADLVSTSPGSPVFAPNLEIRGSTTVQTAYYTNLNSSRSVINHGQFPPVPLVTLPPAPAIAPGAENIAVAPGETRTLPAGSYNSLSLQETGTVVLTGGIYHFSNVTLGRSAQLRFAAPTEIRVASTFYADSGSIIAPQDGAPMTAAQVLIGVYGANASDAENPVAGFAGNHIVAANLYVPNGKLALGQRSQLQGAFIANWVYVGVETRLSLASYYASPIDFSAYNPQPTQPPQPTPPPQPVDSDGDGIPDSEDACPADAQHDTVGNPCNHDEDGDGIHDANDPYPLGNEPASGNELTTSTGSGLTFYVSRNGNNADGRSWATAWNELSQIDWSQIRPGSVIYLDGGQENMLYETTLEIGSSGQPGQPITIQRSTEPGHAGQVMFFGGRSQYLPYCGQQIYDDRGSENYRLFGIYTNNHSHIVIDGMTWRGIDIMGYQRNGIRIERYSSDITVRNVEIRNNGRAVLRDDGWRSDEPGVRLGGSNVTFQRAIIHDNGQDAFQSLWDDNHIANFRLEQSWLYNGRRHPTVDESTNFCTHTDGIQIYDGGHISGVTITESVIGPGFTQGVMLGQSLRSSGVWAQVNDVLMRDVLFTKAADNNIMGYRDTDSHNWGLERVTAHCPNTKYSCLRINNSDHRVTDSIFVGGLVKFDDGLNTFSGNCQWNTEGFELGTVTDPGFAYVNEQNAFSYDDYSVNGNSPCVGSRITSVYQLLNLP